MKLSNALIYSGVLFIITYVMFSVSLRILKLTEDYYSHVIAGIIATGLSIALFLWFVMKKKR